ncbi:P-loop containing nucleoside triphosphate hydrolase protein [Chlamydoabsidia padenii]|nr:P-loop containing nucleoside triphosphate hydrolase protein [Chlamydoabsidia padenii]
MTCPKNQVFQNFTSLQSPWIHSSNCHNKCYVIGISGGSGSGKTSVTERILQKLNIPWVAVISMDSFYKVLTPEQTIMAYQSKFNLDDPSALDHDLLFQCLSDLKSEGIHALYDQRFRDLMDLKIYVDTDADVHLARRSKDMAERGRDLYGILNQYIRFVKPAYDEHIIPRGLENKVAIDLITKHIQYQLNTVDGDDLNGLTLMELIKNK